MEDWKTKMRRERMGGGGRTIYRKKRTVGWGLHIALVVGRLCRLEEIRGSTGRPSTGVEAATSAEDVAVEMAMHTDRASFFIFGGVVNFNERSLLCECSLCSGNIGTQADTSPFYMHVYLTTRTRWQVMNLVHLVKVVRGS